MSRLKRVLIFIGHLFVSTWGVGISSAIVTFYSFAILRPLDPHLFSSHGELVIDGRTLFPRASHIEFLVRMVFLATFSSSVYVLGLDSNVFYALLRSTRWAAPDPRTWFRN